MKKNYLLLAIAALTLTGCNDEEEKDLTIICPTGAPAVAFYDMADDSNFNTVSDSSLLKGYFAAETYDVIVAPTDVGIKSIQQGSNYKLAATITFGNFYIASTGLDDDGEMNEGDSIVIFQQNSLPDKLFHYIYGDEFDSTITYVKNVVVAGTAYENKYVTDENGNRKDADYVLLAEPKVTALKITSGVVSIREAYKAKNPEGDIYQASVFFKNGIKKQYTDEFLEDLKEDITEGLNNPTSIEEELNELLDPQTFIGLSPTLAKNITAKNNGLGLGYKYAKDNKNNIDAFISCLGMEATDESIYY